VRIGFLQALNYPFVVEHSVTVAQIFQVLPIAISYALQVPNSLVITRSLQPLTMSQYTATVAMVWIPQDQYDTLSVAVLAGNSRLYNQIDPTAQQLVKLIDPTIALLADAASANVGGTGTGNSNPNSGSTFVNPGANSGSLDTVDSQGDSSSTPVNSTGKQVAIALGAAGAAVAYAALMFFGAKRFRRQSTRAQAERGHARVSSVTGERAPSPHFAQSYRASGASSGRDVRGQTISPPLMTENSLLL
jgi:hypothetical protein